MYRYLLILILFISVNGCTISNKFVKQDIKEQTYAKTTHFTAKMIKEVQARRAKYLKTKKY